LDLENQKLIKMNYKHYYIRYKYLGKGHKQYNLTVSVPEGIYPQELIDRIKEEILTYHIATFHPLVKEKEFEIITINKL